MAQALAATGQFAEAHETVLECLELVPSSERSLRTQLTAMCARVEHLLGMHERAHDRLARALDELPEEACDHCVSLMIELTMDGVHRMNYAAMMEWGRRAAETAADVDDDALRAAALAAAARGAASPGLTEEARRRRDDAAALIDGLPGDVIARRLDALAYLAGAELYLHCSPRATDTPNGRSPSGARPARPSSFRCCTRSWARRRTSRADRRTWSTCSTARSRLRG
jgi:hypothetical protein